MQLLSADQVKTEKDRGEEERRLRIEGLKIEETAAVKSFNDAKARCDAKKLEIEADLAAFEGKAGARKAELTAEINGLEKRKAKALQPIGAMRDEAEALLKNTKERESKVEAREKALEIKDADLSERAAELLERETDFNDNSERTSEELDRREERVASEEARLKQSQDKLAADWVALHKSTADANADLTRREKEVTDGLKANAEFRKTLDAEAKQQKEDRRGIIDGYATLEAARREILGKKML